MEEELIDDQLEMDQSAYEMYHQAQTSILKIQNIYFNNVYFLFIIIIDAPCLSFDIITDDLGKPRVDYPHTCFLVAGTQAETQSQNKLIIMKLSNLKRTFKVFDYLNFKIIYYNLKFVFRKMKIQIQMILNQKMMKMKNLNLKQQLLIIMDV